jgi:hypothetical protein
VQGIYPDPAVSQGRLDGIMKIIKIKPELYEIVMPNPSAQAVKGSKVK